MAKLILQAILFVTLICALYGAPQNPTSPRNVPAPAIATLEGKPKEKSAEEHSQEEAKIRPARAPHHDGTDHDNKDEHPAAAAKLNEHIDHGSSTTPKPRPARSSESDKKPEEHPGTLTKDSQEPTTSAKPRSVRAAEKDEKHEDHPSSLTKDQQEHKHEATTPQTRPARATEEEKKGAVHDQPIPIPPTLHEHDVKHTEEKHETPKHKREVPKKEKDADESDEDSDEHHEHHQHPESPSTYAKVPSGLEEEDVSLALPNKESEYNRHVRQTNDQPLLLNKGLPQHSHGLESKKQDEPTSTSSFSSEENKSKSS